jgi:hypothetical protein
VSAPSKRTLRLIGDELAGSWTLATISDLFEDEDITCGPPEADDGTSGQRRGLMARYMSGLDLGDPRDQAKLYGVINTVLEGIAARPGSEQWLTKLESSLRRDRIEVDSVTHTIAQSARSRLRDEALNALPDASAIREHLRRLDDNIDTDPRLAVSVAKDLVESTAKLVLRTRGVSWNERSADLPQLVAPAQASLGLSAAGVDASTEEAKALKTILGSLTNLTQGITELRNKVGVGHGRESVPTWVRPRHARLAAGAATVWCQLMLETLDDTTAPWRRDTAASGDA